MTKKMRVDQSDCFKVLGLSNGTIRKYFEDNNHSYQMWAGWLSTPLPLDIILKEPVLYSIHQMFPIIRAGIMTIGKNTCYRWHQDKHRGVGVNMLLEGFNTSATLFGELDDHSTTQIQFQHLNYAPNTLYLFNAQMSHTIINFNGDRYLFSVDFEQGKNQLNYYMIYKAIENGLVEIG